MTAAQWLLRQLCSMIGHRGPALDYMMHETGNFMILDCGRCRTVIIQALDDDLPMEEYEVALMEWLHD